MTRTDTNLDGCFTVDLMVYKDSRGVFCETYQQKKFEKILEREIQFVQDNHSISKRGVLRGLHYQTGDHAQAKLVRVASGSALDVIVDIRPNSPSYGEHFKTILSGANARLVFIPRGMAHGFLALEEDTVFVYKCDNYYHRESEAGIVFNDPDLAIDWEFDEDKILLSEKDKKLPKLRFQNS